MKKIIMALAVSAAFVAMPASADPYVGAGVGVYKTESNRTSYKLFGGFQSSRNFATELAYNDFGNFRGAGADSWSLAAIGILPLDEYWNLFAKAGGSYNRTKFAGSSNNTDLLLGLGVGYNATKNMGVRFEYEDFGKLPNGTFVGASTKATHWGLNVKYSF